MAPYPERIDPRVTYEDQYFHMARPNLADIPQFPFPPGYTLRAYRPGDAVVWTALHRAAEPFFAVEDDLFEQQYGQQRDVLPARVWFVDDDQGQTAASISAWWEKDPSDPADRARVHWVVVHPDHQGRGLTKPMMTVALNVMARHHDAVMLGSSSGRPWAVKVYLDFGFLPEVHELDNPAIVQGWRDVQSVIQHPTLATFLATHVPQPPSSESPIS